MGKVAAHRAERLDAKEVLFDMFSLQPMGERQNLEGMGEVVAHGAKRQYTKDDNIMSIINGWIP